MSTRAPSPFDLLLDQFILEEKQKHKESTKFSAGNLYHSLDYMRRQLIKYFINTEENSTYNAWAKDLCADSIDPIYDGEWKIFFDEFKVIQETYLILRRSARLYLYDISRGEHWPSLRQPDGFFDREKWKPEDYRKPPE